MEQPLHPKDVSVAVAPEIEMPTVPRSKGGGGPSATPLTKNSAPQPSPQPHSPASSLPGLQAQQPRQPSLLPPRRNLYLLTAAVAAFLCAAFVAAGIIVSNAVANAEADNLKAEFSSLCELQSTKIESFAGGRAQLTLLLARSIEALPDPPPRPIMHNLLLSAAGIFASKNPTLALDSTAALFLQYTDAANISEAMDVYRRQYDANDPGKYALYDIRVSNGPITVLPFNSSNTEAFIGTHTSRMPPGLTPTATQARQTALFFNQYSDPDTAAFIDYAVATGEVVSPRPRITIRGVRSLIIAAAVYYTNNTEAVPAFPPGRAFVRGLATTLLWNSTWYAETDQSPLIWWDMVDIEAEFVLVSAQQRQPLRDFRIDGVELRERTLFTQLNRAYAIHCYPTQALVDLYLTNTADALLVVFLVIALLGVFATLFAGYFVRRSTVSRFRLLEREHVFRTERQLLITETQAHERVLGYVHHEIRNPLNAIVGTTELLKTSYKDFSMPLKELLESFDSSSPRTSTARRSTIVWRKPPAPSSHAASPSTTTSRLVSTEDLVVLRRQDLEERQRDVSALQQACEQMELHLHDMLDLQRLRRGELQLNPLALDLQDTLSSILSVWRPLARVPIELHTAARVGTHDVMVVMDEARFRQVLGCGLANALKHTERGKVGVTATVLTGQEAHAALRHTLQAQAQRNSLIGGALEWQPAQEVSGTASPTPDSRPSDSDSDGDGIPHTGVLSVRITDTGPGLNGVPVHKLFKPFVSLRQGTATDEQASGLGLSIAALLAAVMRGGVDLVDLGEGCEFRFNLPVELRRVQQGTSTQTAVDSEPLLPAESATDTEAASAPGLHALVVDDDRTNVLLVTRMLRLLRISSDGIHTGNIPALVENALAQAGHLEDSFVERSAAGEESKEAFFSGKKYDAVFLDIRLGPTTSGVEIVKRLLPHFTQPHVPVIAMTANTRPVDISEYKAAGFAGVVSKPVTKRKLELVVTTLSEGPTPNAWLEC